MGILFGKCVKDAREKKNMRMEDLCLRIKISLVFMYRIERGSVDFPKKRLKSLAKALDIHPLVLKNAMVLDFEDKIHKELIKQRLIRD